MLRVEYARWGQTPADLRELAMSASHPRTRERFLALYEIIPFRTYCVVSILSHHPTFLLVEYC